MILQDSQNCAKVLLSLDIPNEEISDAKETWETSSELREALCSKAVTIQEKYAVCDKLFSSAFSPFVKVMCEFGHINKLDNIFSAYDEELKKSKNILSADLYSVSEPDKSMIDGIKAVLEEKYGVSGVDLNTHTDESLFGGYLLCVGDMEYDKSIAGAVKTLHKKLIRR